MNDNTIEKLRRARDEAQELLTRAEEEHRRAIVEAREARKPKEPEVGENGAVVTFSRLLGGQVYHYAAVGWNARGTVPGPGRRLTRWAITSTTSGGRYNWYGLLNFVGEANWPTLHYVVETVPAINPEDAPPVVEHMGPYGRVEHTEIVEDWHGKAAPGITYTTDPDTGHPHRRSPFDPPRGYSHG